MHTLVVRKAGRFAAVAVAVAVLVFAFQGPAGVRTAEAITNCHVADMTFDAQEQAFLTLINQYRAQHGLQPLTASVNLNRSASWHARDMATKRYFSHTDSLNRSPAKRITDCGGLMNVGENLAAGTTRDTAQKAFDAWKASAGHNANMLNASFRQIGIARYYDASAPYRWYWVTTFSTTNDGTNASTGGTTTQPPPSSTTQKAVMQSPTQGSTLSTSQMFRWSSVSGAVEYKLDIGTTAGSANMLSASVGTNTAFTVNGFPRTGRTVYVRLWTRTSGGWQYNDYSYRLPR
jgi:uncharacterized protein YkwD